MVITYQIGNSLYINITNHCTNRCVFCLRDTPQPEPYCNLFLDREPTVEEIADELVSYDLNDFDEIVFCGYGEPTCRLYDMLEVCKRIRMFTKTPIRVNTNGHASMILGEDTPHLFAGLVDCVSISLNAADSETYSKVCRPRFGEDTFAGVVKFAREVARYVPTVVLSVVEGTIPHEDIERCRDIARSVGATFRLREKQ